MPSEWKRRSAGNGSRKVYAVTPPVSRSPTGLINDRQMNLQGLADLLGRPLAHSPEEGVAYIGPAMELFDHTVKTLEAPDFTLPDLEGRFHSLSEHRGSKVLLAAWASW